MIDGCVAHTQFLKCLSKLYSMRERMKLNLGHCMKVNADYLELVPDGTHSSREMHDSIVLNVQLLHVFNFMA